MALRVAAEAVLWQADAILAGMDPPAAPIGDADASKCEHPEEKRVSCGTVGDPAAWFCPVCKHTSDEIKVP